MRLLVPGGQRGNGQYGASVLPRGERRLVTFLALLRASRRQRCGPQARATICTSRAGLPPSSAARSACLGPTLLAEEPQSFPELARLLGVGRDHGRYLRGIHELHFGSGGGHTPGQQGLRVGAGRRPRVLLCRRGARRAGLGLGGQRRRARRGREVVSAGPPGREGSWGPQAHSPRVATTANRSVLIASAGAIVRRLCVARRPRYDGSALGVLSVLSGASARR